jgi:hypothetical protein
MNLHLISDALRQRLGVDTNVGARDELFLAGTNRKISGKLIF